MKLYSLLYSQQVLHISLVITLFPTTLRGRLHSNILHTPMWNLPVFFFFIIFHSYCLQHCSVSHKIHEAESRNFHGMGCHSKLFYLKAFLSHLAMTSPMIWRGCEMSGNYDLFDAKLKLYHVYELSFELKHSIFQLFSISILSLLSNYTG